METKKDEGATWKAVQRDKAVEVVKAAPSIHDILARPTMYEAWLRKLQEAVNG